jgi:hypothetical protein
MSFLGMGRPQPSSEEKIAMMENEITAMSDLHNRFVPLFITPEGGLPAATQKRDSDLRASACPKKDEEGRKEESKSPPELIEIPIQPIQDLRPEVHPQRLPRRRDQQGRVRLPRPLQRKVLRGVHEDQRAHADLRPADAGRREAR